MLIAWSVVKDKDMLTQSQSKTKQTKTNSPGVVSEEDVNGT